MRRDERLNPRVSWRTAACVRSPSENPKALKRASTAPGRRRSSSSPAANASSSGRKYSRSWMARTVLWWRARVVSSCSSALPSGVSRKPSVRPIRVRSSSETGIEYIGVPSRSCSRCSRQRRKRYASASWRASSSST